MPVVGALGSEHGLGYERGATNRWNLGAGLRVREDLKTHLSFAK
jgi:hypothetical protein